MNPTRGALLVIAFAAQACLPPTTGTVEPPVPVVEDSTTTAGIPVGYGSLRQDDIAIRLEPPGLIVRAIPLDEKVIRLLTPDSYRALRDLQDSNRRTIENITRRSGGRLPDLWYVSFYGIEENARFAPMDLVITSGGQDFRPVDVIPLTTGFGEQRLRQRETQAAVYIYPGDIDVDHPLTVRFQGEQSVIWEQLLQRIERERALVRARATGSGR
ncbi:MAG: hypothetical protein M3R07_06825 [Gemmatimonadota bacterium]|nr:hypothetical protein [Gemmatimonadota bacterium]